MFGLEIPAWAIALQIVGVVWFLLGAYVIIFWTPINFLLRLVVHDWRLRRKRKKLAPKDKQQKLERAYWDLYCSWVNTALTWRCGIELSRQRSEGKTFALLHGVIYRSLAVSQVPESIGKSAKEFGEWAEEPIENVAKHMARELLRDTAATASVTEFLRGEQRHIRRFPEEFAQHADRLAEHFGIRPFEVQSWLAEELEGEA